ncbi:hypothetical protein ACFLT4_00255 [Chloroflexota bacterium]
MTGTFLEVYDPSGTVSLARHHHATRLASLDGKTIGELSHYRWESSRTFPVIRKLLQKRFPDIKIIPYTDFPNISSIEPDVLSKLLMEKGCDGFIVGNAA